MAAVPIYVWNGTAWQETGPTIPASPIKYQASAPSSPSTGDIWVDSDADVTSGSQQFQRFRFVASGGETSVSGVDANSAVLAYTAGTEIVVLNGSTLVRGSDYTATNGTSITGLSPALVAGDVLEVFSFMAFNVANTYTQSQVDGFITSANAEPGMKLIIPTSVSTGATISSSGAVTFTSQSSVSLNGCFTSTYDNYLIIFRLNAVTADGALNFKLRASGTDTSTGYYYAYVGLRSDNTANNSNAANTTSFNLIDYDTGSSAKPTFIKFELYNPFIAEPTSFTAQSIFSTTTGTPVAWSGGGVQTASTSFDGLSFLPSSGNITGSIRVYGYKN